MTFVFCICICIASSQCKCQTIYRKPAKIRGFCVRDCGIGNQYISQSVCDEN